MHPQQVPTIGVADVPDDAKVLDVREDDEWAAGHIANAVHVPMFSVPQRVAYAPDDFGGPAPLVVVCRVGSRSAQVTAWLNRNGVEAVNLDGGMVAWASARRPMTSETGAPPHVA